MLAASLAVVGPDSTALALSLHRDVAGSASAFFGTTRIAVGALGSSLVGVWPSVLAEHLLALGRRGVVRRSGGGSRG